MNKKTNTIKWSNIHWKKIKKKVNQEKFIKHRKRAIKSRGKKLYIKIKWSNIHREKIEKKLNFKKR